MDPREMVYLMQSDFKSNRFAAVVFALIIGLGIACWFQALSSQSTARTTTPDRQPISVLPDPFEKS